MPYVAVRDVNGIPLPNSEILERLKRIHPSLGLRYRAMEWCITWEWPEHDRRWEWVKTGQQSPDSAYDTIGRLPLDCPPDQAASYVENSLRAYPVEDIRKMADRMTHYNRTEVPKEQLAEAMDATFDAMGAFVGKTEGFSAGGIDRSESPETPPPAPKPRKKR